MRSGSNFDTNSGGGVGCGDPTATAFHARHIALESHNAYFRVTCWYPPVPFAFSLVSLRRTVYAVNLISKQSVKLTDKPILLFVGCRVFFEHCPVDNHWLRIDCGMAQGGGNNQLFM
jgi:hypothetical protein